jgi:broad specificity phosphatase PhoE
MNGGGFVALPAREHHCQLRLILLRHGQPTDEARGRCYGRLDIGLSSEGRRQIRSKIALVASLQPGAIYSSTAKRAIESAEEIGHVLNLQAKLSRKLSEIDFGTFEGMSYEEIKACYPQLFKEWMTHPTKVKFPGGESFEEMRRRALSFQAFLLRTHKRQTVLAVSHGGVNRLLLAEALRLPEQTLFRIDQAYAAVNIIDYYRDFALVRLVNA